MLVLAAVLTAASVVALVVAIALSSGLLFGWICIGLSATGLVLLTVDWLRRSQEPPPPPAPTAPLHTAGEDSYGDYEVEREIDREEHPLSRDMLGEEVPHEEILENLRQAGHDIGHHHDHHGDRREV